MRKRAAWYCKSVKNKVNKSWPREEKLRVLDLCESLTAKEVAGMFNTSVTVINNIKRVTKKALNRQCYKCGRPLTEAEIINGKNRFAIPCDDCKEELIKYKSRLRKKALKKGLCGYCGKKPVIPGHTGCVQCQSATQRRRIRQGLCGTCGKRPLMHPNGAVCKICSIKAGTVAKQRVAA